MDMRSIFANMAAGNTQKLQKLLRYFMPRFTRISGSNTVTLARPFSCLSRCNSAVVNDNMHQANREDSSSNDVELRTSFVNRNPRNEEYSGHNKPRGYSTQFTRRDFYNRLRLIISNRHTKAIVSHNSGTTLAQASTTEFLITKHLYKTTDISAARNIGRVLAQRCQLAGLTRVAWEPEWGDKKKLRVKAFERAMRRGGIQLTEPRQVIPVESFYTDFRPKKNRRKWVKMPNSLRQ